MAEIIWTRDKKIDLGKVKRLEASWQVVFPHNYINVVIEHDEACAKIKTISGKLKAATINIKGFDISDFYLLGINDIVYNGLTRVESALDSYKESLPEKVYPFAEGSGGDIFLFDYRDDVKEPSIKYLLHEERVTADDLYEEDLQEKPLEEWLNDNLLFVANSFDEMLTLFYVAD